MGRLEEALPVLEASLALRRRRWSSDENQILIAQGNVASCLADLGRNDEALVLKREVFARYVAVLGASHERTIQSGCNVAVSMKKLGQWEETRQFVRNQLLPEARRSLGSNHDSTLRIHQILANALRFDPEHTRDDLLEAEAILQDVAQRRRLVFGPAHPETRRTDTNLSKTRAQLSHA